MIRVGVAGWDYADWRGIVYPSPLPRGFDRLAHLAGFFDVIEINVTFYHLPDASQARSWARRLEASGTCRFTAKLHRDLTHATIGPGRAGQPSCGDLAGVAGRYLAGIAPLQSAGLLLCTLVQFPHSFHDGAQSRAHLARLRDLLADLSLVVEFRHRSWDHDDALRFLRTLGVGFCNIDQPLIGSTLRPTAHMTSRLGYIRLHGRNARNWFRQDAPVAARYDYLYAQEELDPWVARARAMEGPAEEVIIIANNHYRGQGPANALMMKAAVARTRVRAPSGLVRTFPVLDAIADPDTPDPAQRSLFNRR